MSRFWRGVAIAAGSVLAAAAISVLLPIHSRIGIKTVRTKNYSKALQLGYLLSQSASDHFGRFPMNPSELIPDGYLTEGEAAAMQFEVGEDSGDSVYAKQDWLYFGAFFSVRTPPLILIASPQTTGFKSEPPKRIVISGNLNGSLMNEDQYQIELEKTIEAMHQRARSTGLESKPNAEPANPNSEPK